MSPLRALCVATALLIAALAACAAPASAGAAEPQITAAGIDASDRLVATWTLAPGTRFESIEFATGSILDDVQPSFADVGTGVGFGCSPPPARDCTAKPDQTTYREPKRVARDRRYFVVVVASRSDGTELLSQIWVIDDRKPLIADFGREPPSKPSNSPVLGRPLVEPAVSEIPAPKLVVRAPKTIAGLLRRGVRVQLTCPAHECYADVGLLRGDDDLAYVDRTLRPGERRTFVLRAPRLQHAALRRRARTRLRVQVDIYHPGRRTRQILRNVSVRR